MKILHLSTQDVMGGAARAAYRLHCGLRRVGHDSSMLVAARFSNDPDVVAFRPPSDLPSRIQRRLRRRLIERSFGWYQAMRPSGLEAFSDDRVRFGATLLDQLPPCDVINLHWVADFVDYHGFFATVPQRTPVVWTLHDMNPFTGGCHYDGECGEFASSCGRCPQLGSGDLNDLSKQIWERKAHSLEPIGAQRLQIVTPSHWLASEARRSSLFAQFPVVTIPYGIDLYDFAPRDRGLGRDTLGIPRSAKVVLFVAESIANRRKGFAFLERALAELTDVDNLFLVVLGNCRTKLEFVAPHLELGRVDNDRLLSLIYSSADVFVVPSAQDNLPNTILESIACGTPVIGFAIGGIPDIVRPGKTGLLVPAQDVTALAEAIRRLLRDDAIRTEMSSMCRTIALEEYALETQASRYATLYENMLHLPHRSRFRNENK